MQTQAPVLDVLISRDGDAWRLYFAPHSWMPGLIGRPDRGSIFPVAKPDLDDLRHFMWKLDAPYEERRAADGGAAIVAKGRSAIALAVWLGDFAQSARPGAVAPVDPFPLRAVALIPLRARRAFGSHQARFRLTAHVHCTGDALTPDVPMNFAAENVALSLTTGAVLVRGTSAPNGPRSAPETSRKRRSRSRYPSCPSRR
jgi:hypothetical protein